MIRAGQPALSAGKYRQANGKQVTADYVFTFHWLQMKVEMVVETFNQ